MAVEWGQPLLEGQANQKTILIVDDDQATGEVLEMALTEDDASYRPLVVQSAAQALRIAQEHRVDLFILDYRLLDMNGIELYHRLHEGASSKPAPALIVSACLASHEPELHAHQLHGLAKPFELAELLEKVAQLLT
jgi:DNA-binding response OmpR family regulator